MPPPVGVAVWGLAASSGLRKVIPIPGHLAVVAVEHLGPGMLEQRPSFPRSLWPVTGHSVICPPHLAVGFVRCVMADDGA